MELVKRIIERELATATEELKNAQKIEEENDYSDAMQSMERKYWEGYTDALLFLIREIEGN